jgi:hypothetical protein
MRKKMGGGAGRVPHAGPQRRRLDRDMRGCSQVTVPPDAVLPEPTEREYPTVE